MSAYRPAAAAFLSLLAIATAVCQETVLFVSGDPLGSRVIIDGRPLDRPAPVLVRSLPPGIHRVELQRHGYHDETAEVSLEAGGVAVVSPSLRRIGFAAGFPGEPQLLLGNGERPGEGRLWSFSLGSYSFSRRADGRLRVAPAFPRQRLADALAIAIPAFLGFATYLTIDAVANPPDSGWAVPPVVLTTHVLTAAMIGAEVWLQVQKQQFLEGFAFEPQAAGDPVAEQQTYDQATQLLQLGGLAEARAAFGRIEPGGRLYPHALYKISSIHVTSGAHEQALEGFDRIASEYPLPDLYDRSLKGAADVLVLLGRYSESLDRLASMAFADRMYGREEIDAYASEILARWAAESPEVLPRAIEAHRRLTTAYPSSPRIGAYRAALDRLLAAEAAPRR